MWASFERKIEDSLCIRVIFKLKEELMDTKLKAKMQANFKKRLTIIHFNYKTFKVVTCK